MSENQAADQSPAQDPQNNSPIQPAGQPPPGKKKLSLTAAILWIIGSLVGLCIVCGIVGQLAPDRDPTPTAAAQVSEPIDTPAKESQPEQPTATSKSTNAPEPEDTPTSAPTDTPEPTATPAPTDTPLPTDTPIPTLSKEEALRKWRAPFVASAFSYTLCKQVSEKPGGVPPLAVIVGLGVSAGTLEEWVPEPDQVGIEQDLKAALQEFSEAFEENGQADFPAAAAEICPTLQTVLNDIREAVKTDGLTDEDLQAILEEVQKNLEAAAAATPEATATQEVAAVPTPTSQPAPAPTDTPAPAPPPPPAGLPKDSAIGVQKQIGIWAMKLYQVKKAKAVYYFGDPDVADGVYLMPFIEFTNTGSGSRSPVEDLDLYIVDGSANRYDLGFSDGDLGAAHQFQAGHIWDDMDPGAVLGIVVPGDVPEGITDAWLKADQDPNFVMYLGDASTLPME